MDAEQAARCLAELGNLTRLDIYRLLMQAGRSGLNISQLQARLDVPASTLAFHLRGLVGTGLVTQQKDGRQVICRARFKQLNAVVDFLRDKCCRGFEDDVPAKPQRRAS